MNDKKQNIRNLTMLTGFAAVFSVITLVAVKVDRRNDAVVTPSVVEHEMVVTMASTVGETAKSGLLLSQKSDEELTENSTLQLEGNEAVALTPPSGDSISSSLPDSAVSDSVSGTLPVSSNAATLPETAVYDSVSGTLPVSSNAAALPEKTLYTVTEYESPQLMYASATVNVRSGAGTDYDKLGSLKWGSKADVTGRTDNGWYEVSYNGEPAFVRGDFMIEELPGTPLLFVGDSRTVQLQMAVGNSDKAYIAEVGEGYNYFKNTALPAIPSYAGHGTKMIINFGVNDLTNVDNYIELVNNNIDAWSDAGISVYYASVTPVSSYPTVNNAQIEAFNKKLKNSLDSRVKWIDGYSYLSRNGFNTPDGLHYTPETYKKLYSYYLSVIDQV